MSALKKPSATVQGMQKGLDTVQAEPATPNPYLEADRRLAAARPPKPTRVTLDLDQERHDFLKSFSAGLSSARVLRALLDELKADPGLRDRVLHRVLG